ncbi:hypothetical protein [Vibrio sp. D431a]|uniref:hypothetical protein n=1 Tax=Vibrio sp. D431a TaxID=2837388 RepID=UPI002556AE71|nr:hypothetical protein [Vibrio sp. D431a]MDK9793236.1 hypothetical protein [Vibrio sp. D431a]
MGTFSCRIIGSDEVIDFLDTIERRLNNSVKEVKMPNGEMRTFKLTEEDEVSFSCPNELPHSSQYSLVCEAMKQHHDKVFDENCIYEPEILFGVATLFMALGVPISTPFRNECIDNVLSYNTRQWKQPERRKAFLDSFLDALLSYDNETPLFEHPELRWETPEKLIGLQWTSIPHTE